MPQPKRGLVATKWARTTATKSTIAATIQRPGWRTGTARMSSGRRASAPAPPGGAETGSGSGLADGAVDLRGGDGARLDPPLGEDRLVPPVGDQHLQRREQGTGQPAALGDGDPVRERAVGLAHQLELPAGLLDLIDGHRVVGHGRLPPAAA